MTLNELPAYLAAIRDRAAEAAIPAANGMADHFETVVKERLTEKSHARGTRTPSAPGEPPAMESGDLAGSVTVDPATTPVVATAKCGPRLPPRDWVQEWGIPGGIHVRRAKFMRYEYDGPRFSKWVPARERSYMRSTAELLIADGSLSRVGAEAFYAYMWG